MALMQQLPGLLTGLLARSGKVIGWSAAGATGVAAVGAATNEPDGSGGLGAKTTRAIGQPTIIETSALQGLDALWDMTAGAKASVAAFFSGTLGTLFEYIYDMTDWKWAGKLANTLQASHAGQVEKIAELRDNSRRAAAGEGIAKTLTDSVENIGHNITGSDNTLTNTAVGVGVGASGGLAAWWASSKITNGIRNLFGGGNTPPPDAPNGSNGGSGPRPPGGGSPQASLVQNPNGRLSAQQRASMPWSQPAATPTGAGAQTANTVARSATPGIGRLTTTAPLTAAPIATGPGLAQRLSGFLPGKWKLAAGAVAGSALVGNAYADEETPEVAAPEVAAPESTPVTADASVIPTGEPDEFVDNRGFFERMQTTAQDLNPILGTVSRVQELKEAWDTSATWGDFGDKLAHKGHNYAYAVQESVLGLGAAPEEIYNGLDSFLNGALPGDHTVNSSAEAIKNFSTNHMISAPPLRDEWDARTRDMGTALTYGIPVGSAVRALGGGAKIVNGADTTINGLRMFQPM